MESNRSKRRGLISKSKLIMSIYRATKPSSAALHNQPYSGKSPSSNSSDFEFMANHIHHPIKPKAPPPTGFIIVNQDHQVSNPQQKPKVAFVVPDRSNNIGSVDSYGSKLYAEDEAVDAKAARYISSVQERFRLERVNSERLNTQDLQLL